MVSQGSGSVDDAAFEPTWDQVLAWRVKQHRLVERAGHAALMDVVGAICCLHAQLLSSAELSLWARVDGVTEDELMELMTAVGKALDRNVLTREELAAGGPSRRVGIAGGTR